MRMRMHMLCACHAHATHAPGAPLLVRKAYNTIAPSAGRFIGFWADVTALLTPGATQTLTLELPPAAGWVAAPGSAPGSAPSSAPGSAPGSAPESLVTGGDLERLSGSVRAAQKRCGTLPYCAGLTFALSAGASCADALAPAATISSDEIYLKSSSVGGNGAGWCSLLRPAALQGVHFENVEAMLSTDNVLLQPSLQLE